MDTFPYNYPLQGSQASENVHSRASQLLVYPSPLNNSPSTHVVTSHKHVSLSSRFKRPLVIATTLPLLPLILVICSTLSPQ
uniref:Ovule protein n=1 Tax=Echinococcus granulosus TaxID=6210 RepID=A0A068WT91_ECHGR|nr:hypothetical protein EgrG_002040000 [Echinococcus granulosus]